MFPLVKTRSINHPCESLKQNGGNVYQLAVNFTMLVVEKSGPSLYIWAVSLGLEANHKSL